MQLMCFSNALRIGPYESKEGNVVNRSFIISIVDIKHNDVGELSNVALIPNVAVIMSSAVLFWKSVECGKALMFWDNCFRPISWAFHCELNNNFINH
jgi:hypothetical protein